MSLATTFTVGLAGPLTVTTAAATTVCRGLGKRCAVGDIYIVWLSVILTRVVGCRRNGIAARIVLWLEKIHNLVHSSLFGMRKENNPPLELIKSEIFHIYLVYTKMNIQMNIQMNILIYSIRLFFIRI